MAHDKPDTEPNGDRGSYSSSRNLEAYPGSLGQPQRTKTTAGHVQTPSFAGRLGGNQRFTSSSDSVVTADAVRNASWARLLDPTDFKHLSIWKYAIIEGIATCLQLFLGLCISVGLLPTGDATSLGPVTPVAFASVIQVFVIALFVYSTGPLTGGHLNPLITMGTFFAGLSSLPRTVLYIVFQCAGAIIGSLIFRESIGASPADLVVVPGCWVDTSIVTPGQAFGFELMATLLTLFLAFGLGLDPRNAGPLGPGLPPILIGISSAVTVFGGAIARPGYLGASMNPARCLGVAVASHNFTYHYIHWTGSLTAALLNGGMYFLLPPYKM
ncbi:hypothetical protein PV10_05498 [Exophiala mesophila]|uniref:Aquaporin n=1 Tax=Exophiala mesophila TaxID=212818 RepID=A0A0D1ZA86_EXOME|nr:uncharacterized protein PV10_05498 [Exophiala mesophila]KIV90894.1 hypothetical protein PV10_05498 [Exophiala mesophila]